MKGRAGRLAQNVEAPAGAAPVAPAAKGGAAFERATTRPRDAATLSWSALTVTVRDAKGAERRILKGVDGFAVPGEMLAIMGPSGCGKSTLLDTLAGRLAPSARWSGAVLVNGRKTALSYGKANAAYVTQDDVLVAALTVRETVVFAARLRLPAGTPMGLDAARDTYIGDWLLRGVSGGQRRRVSIAQELVTSPALVFLDEPTSGLDAAAAHHVVKSVRALAAGGRTVVAVVHQPSAEAFESFSSLLLLAAGNAVYFGPAARVGAVFAAAALPAPANRNPADWFLRCVNADFAEEEEEEEGGGGAGGAGGRGPGGGAAAGRPGADANIAALLAAYGASPERAAAEAAAAEARAPHGAAFRGPPPGPGWGRQTAVLAARAALNNLRNPGMYWLRVGIYLVLGIFVGAVFFDVGDSYRAAITTVPALLFFIVAFFTFMSIAAFPAFIEDIKCFNRERLNGWYGVSQFTVGYTLASLPFIFAIALPSAAVLYWMAGLRPEAPAFAYFVLLLFASVLCMESLMLAIAARVPNFLVGTAIAAGITGTFILTCGFFQDLQDMPQPIFRYPLAYISFHTWITTGAMRNEYEDTMWGCSEQCAAAAGADCELTGDDVLSYYGILGVSKWGALGILLGMSGLYRLVFFGFSKAREARRR